MILFCYYVLYCYRGRLSKLSFQFVEEHMSSSFFLCRYSLLNEVYIIIVIIYLFILVSCAVTDW